MLLIPPVPATPEATLAASDLSNVQPRPRGGVPRPHSTDPSASRALRPRGRTRSRALFPDASVTGNDRRAVPIPGPCRLLHERAGPDQHPVRADGLATDMARQRRARWSPSSRASWRRIASCRRRKNPAPGRSRVRRRGGHAPPGKPQALGLARLWYERQHQLPTQAFSPGTAHQWPKLRNERAWWCRSAISGLDTIPEGRHLSLRGALSLGDEPIDENCEGGTFSEGERSGHK